MLELENLIGGRWRRGNGLVSDDRNPAQTSQVVACVSLATPPDVDACALAARQAAAAWQNASIHQRATVLRTCADLLDQRAEDYGRELTIEEGKTLPESIGEVKRAAAIFRFFSSEATRESGEIFASSREAEQILVRRKPLGVVLVVTPWNFPIAIPAWKIAPALVYGNCVIWKPASLVPLMAYRLTSALVDAGVPDGVVSLLHGRGELAERALRHPDVDAVTFTGSTEVGRSLISTCATLGKPIQAEMGGNNAAIILRDADLASATKQVVSGAMQSSGQKCTATSRVILEEPIADEAIEQICKATAALRVGDGLDPAVDLGPLASADSAETVVGQIGTAESNGGLVLVGGKEPVLTDSRLDGYFVAPTVIDLGTTVAQNPIWSEEVFGPVLSVVRASDEDAAFHLANDSRFGLSCSVFTSNLGTALRSMDEVACGVLHVNSETTGAEPHVPFGGDRESGWGPKEQGRAAREFFTKVQTVYMRG